MARSGIRPTLEYAVGALQRVGAFRARFRRNRALRILCYHGVCSDADASALWVPDYFVSASRFAEQMELLGEMGPVVFLPDYLRRAQGEPDEACSAVTFDDVAACTLHHALPVLERCNIRASFFVATGFARSGRLFLPDVLLLVRSCPELVTPELRRALAHLLRDRQAHKRLPLHAVAGLAADAQAMIASRADPHIIGAMRCLNWDELRQVAARGHEIGGHTVDHAILGRQAPQVRSAQIAECTQDITREIGTAPVGFAFPNGEPGDFDASDQALLAQFGYAYAVGMHPGAVTRPTDVFNLPRLGVGMRQSTALLAARLAGLLDGRCIRSMASCPVPGPAKVKSGEAADQRERETASMRPQEYAQLERLLRECRPRRTLEVGMANGESSERICAHLHAQGGGRHIAIDPFQLDPDGWAGRGIARIERAGLAEYLEVIAKPDYIALPELAARGERFDFILIDGWHSFDHTQIDLFYADLLLQPGGMLVVHDTNWPAVYRACRFLETHKPYEPLGPPISVNRKLLVSRLVRRLGQVLGGASALRAARARRGQWFALGAYRKRADCQVPNDFYAAF